MTIDDLKEGDFLTMGDWIFILSELREDAENSYLIVYHALWNGGSYMVTETRPGIGHVNHNCKAPNVDIHYATNQQRKEFCDELRKRRAMKWDEVNNNLVSIYEP